MLLIIGASGRVGQRLRQAAQASGVRDVQFLARQASGPDLLAWQPGKPLPPARAALVLSGVTAGTAAELALNASLGAAIADDLRRAGIPLCLYASTQAVYGRTPPEGAAENTPPEAPNAYGLAKLAAEQAVAANLAGSATRLVSLRLGNVAGADMLGAKLRAGQEITLDQFADGRGPRRSYLGAGCLLHLARGLADAAGPLPQVLNVAGGDPVDMIDLMRAAGLPCQLRAAPPGAVALAAMDCSLLAGWRPDLLPSSAPEVLARDLTAAAQEARA